MPHWKIDLDPDLTNQATVNEILALVAEASGKPTHAADVVPGSSGGPASILVGHLENPATDKLAAAIAAIEANGSVVRAVPVAMGSGVDFQAPAFTDGALLPFGSSFVDPSSLLNWNVLPLSTVNQEWRIRAGQGTGGTQAACYERNTTGDPSGGNFKYAADSGLQISVLPGHSKAELSFDTKFDGTYAAAGSLVGVPFTQIVAFITLTSGFVLNVSISSGDLLDGFIGLSGPGGSNSDLGAGEALNTTISHKLVVNPGSTVSWTSGATTVTIPHLVPDCIQSVAMGSNQLATYTADGRQIPKMCVDNLDYNILI